MNDASASITWRSESRTETHCSSGSHIWTPRGVPHSGIIDTGYGPTVVFRDPDNMQLEFYVHQTGDDMPQLTDADSAEAQQILHAAE